MNKRSEAALSSQVEVDGGGLRDNEGKLRYDLIPPDAQAEVAKVFTKGAEKYAERNWERGQKYSVPLASMLRHLYAWIAGEDYDKESGCHHLAHVAVNALFLLAFHMRGMYDLDDRNKLTSVQPKGGDDERAQTNK